MQLFVIGMHRSGTSGITRILNMAGAYFGPEGMSNGADQGNPKGFWERLDIRAACDGLLQDAGFDWWRVAGFSIDEIPEAVRDEHLTELKRILLEIDAHRPWVVKEPRLSLLFPLLRPLLEVPLCIHVTREPLEVAESLRTRNELPPQVGLALWEQYTIKAFQATEGLPRVLVRYEDLMAVPVDTVTGLLSRLNELGAYGLRVPSDPEITAFITPDLHRQHRSAELRDRWLNEQQARLAAAIDDDTVLDPGVVPAVVSEGARETLAEYETARDRSAQVEQEMEDLRNDLQELETTMENELRGLESTIEDLTTKAADLEERRAGAEDRAEHLQRDLRFAGEALRTAARDLENVSRSRSWRLAWRAMSARRMLTPGMSRKSPSPLSAALRGIQKSKDELERESTESGEPPPAAPASSSSTSTAGRSGRAKAKVAVLAWDVGHNPLGRAYALAGILRGKFDVEIWGAQFERYGSHIWAPLRNSEIPVRAFDGHNFPDHLGVMEAMAQKIDADVVYVSKPRLPSYALGVLAKEARNRPLVLDVDDHELAFFHEDAGLDVSDVMQMRVDDDVLLPFGRTWTRVCQPLIEAADHVTVSNTALQDRFGGVIVPHARDGRIFDPARYDRNETRRSLGLSASKRLLLFGGTPRVHKGILEVLRALETLGDDRYRVLLFGTRELNTLRGEIGELERWVRALPYQRFEDLPRLVGAADLACVLQDPEHPVSRYQLPAKVTDALAMGVPCLVRPVPPLQSLVDEGVLQTFDDDEPLHERIARVFDDYDEAIDRARNGRKLFEENYSYEAVAEDVAPVFERLLNVTPPLSPQLAAVVDAPRRVFGPVRTDEPRTARVPGRRLRSIPDGAQFDVVMFWKQNDTGIYGRRQDMFLKYLAQSDRVHSIVHFDRPTTPEDLYKAWRKSSSTVDQRRLVVRQTVSRLLRRRDTDQVHFHTYLFAGKATKRLGLPSRREHPEYVRSVLKRHGIGTRPTIFWVYPTNNDLPPLIDALDPEIVVADVVDDHRTFADEGSSRYDEFQTNYEEVLARSDVVLANCKPVAEGMAQLAPEVHVVPNGCELMNGGLDVPRPAELRDLTGPIIGYVGNLSQRLDIPLIETLVRGHPAWEFVFVGSAHFDRSILRLDVHPNVRFVGVKPYDETVRFIQHFDVAIIPHVDNVMTRSMNPLKAFVYCSTGVPVVSTPVANLSELADLITIADGPDEFAAAIEAALASGRHAPDLQRLTPHSWQARVEQAIGLVDRAVGASRAQ